MHSLRPINVWYSVASHSIFIDRISYAVLYFYMLICQTQSLLSRIGRLGKVSELRSPAAVIPIPAADVDFNVIRVQLCK